MHLSAIVPDAQAPSAFSNALNSVVTAWGQIEAIKTQRQLSELNLRRAQQGLPPIQLDVLPGAVPTVQVQADIAPGTKAQLQLAAIMIAGIATIALLTRRR